MIILYEESEKEFESLGLGVLKDAITCKVKEELNNVFELEMTYGIDGTNYDKIKEGRIIGAKPNPYDSLQPFRIANISKPIKGVVTITAFHVSYDMNGIPVKAIDAEGLNDTITKIKDACLIDNNFKFITDISSPRKFKTTQPYNLRAILLGDEEHSLTGVYDAELKFDKYTVGMYTKRGKNRGAQVCYGYNMTDLKHESSSDKLYNGVFPYYHKEKTSSETNTEEGFTKAYIINSSKAFLDGWLSLTEGGEAYHPLENTSPVQIATEGDFYDRVYMWDHNKQKFVEKIYNQSVTLIEGVASPTWIIIDWKSFPIISCRANAKGYFKSPNDMEWGDIKGVGDVIFEGNILKEGLSGMASNMIIYYSEVIPTSEQSSTEEVTEIIDVFIDEENPIIKLNTQEARAMMHDKILSLDLTSEFEDDTEPTPEQLRAKAEDYISKHKIGTLVHTTTVSFIDLSTTTEAGKYKNFEHIEIGDTVRVIYRDSGVDVELRVLSTNYNVINGQYESINLGEKEDTLSTESIQNGDNITSLTNDAGYADITTVNKLIASVVTAEYINAANAKLSKAQIEQLEVQKIACPGIIEASQFALDELIAKLLVAENAKITNVLEAGEIKVKGRVEVTGGAITILGEDDTGTKFIVDSNGNLEANSVYITGGTLTIGDGTFEVTNDGQLTAMNANIIGKIIATDGEIGGCKIENGVLIVDSANINGLLTANDIRVTSDDNITETEIFVPEDASEFYSEYIEIVDENDGTRTVKAKIKGLYDYNREGYISVGRGETIKSNITVTGNTTIWAKELVIFEANSQNNYAIIGGFDVGPSYLKCGDLNSLDDTTGNGIYISYNGIRLGQYFFVNDKGYMESLKGNIGNWMIDEEGYLYSNDNDAVEHKIDIPLNLTNFSSIYLSVTDDTQGLRHIIARRDGYFKTNESYEYYEKDNEILIMENPSNITLYFKDYPLGMRNTVFLAPKGIYGKLGYGSQGKNWLFAVSDAFGVTTDGEVYFSSGENAVTIQKQGISTPILNVPGNNPEIKLNGNDGIISLVNDGDDPYDMYYTVSIDNVDDSSVSFTINSWENEDSTGDSVSAIEDRYLTVEIHAPCTRISYPSGNNIYENRVYRKTCIIHAGEKEGSFTLDIELPWHININKADQITIEFNDTSNYEEASIKGEIENIVSLLSVYDWLSVETHTASTPAGNVNWISVDITEPGIYMVDSSLDEIIVSDSDLPYHIFGQILESALLTSGHTITKVSKSTILTATQFSANKKYVSFSAEGGICPSTSSSESIGSYNYRWKSSYIDSSYVSNIFGPRNGFTNYVTLCDDIMPDPNNQNGINIGKNDNISSPQGYFNNGYFKNIVLYGSQQTNGNEVPAEHDGKLCAPYIYGKYNNNGFKNTGEIRLCAQWILPEIKGTRVEVQDNLIPENREGYFDTGNRVTKNGLTYRIEIQGGTSLGNSNYPFVNVVSYNNTTLGYPSAASDRRVKDNICYDMNEYDLLFDNLKPASYTLKIDGNISKHFGFIAQDVEESSKYIIDSGDNISIYSKNIDFPSFLKDETMNDNEKLYCLNYNEFIPLLVKQVQDLKKRVKYLEDKEILNT